MNIQQLISFLVPLFLVGCSFPKDALDYTEYGTMQKRVYSPANEVFSITVPESDWFFKATDEKRGTQYLADFFFASKDTNGRLVYSIEVDELDSGTEKMFLDAWENNVQDTYLNNNFGKHGRYQLRDQQRIRLSGGQQASLFVAQGNHNSSSKTPGVIYGCAVRFKEKSAIMYVLRNEPKLNGPTNSLPGMKDFLSYVNSLRVHK
jgi:hypothetical protein